MNWRRSEFISVSTLLLVASWLWWTGAKMQMINITIAEVEVIKDKESLNEKSIAVVMDRLDDMKEDLRYLRRHANK